MNTCGAAHLSHATIQSFGSSLTKDLWNATPHWYAAFTLAHHEKQVSTRCEQRGVDVFLPLYTVKHKWKNRCTVDLELPLFPCYFFVRIVPRNRVLVLEVPGVVAIVSSGRELLSVPDDYIRALREGLLLHKVEPYQNLEVGDLARIKRGPFAGSEGILDRRKNGLRVIIRLEMLARSVSVEVGEEDIESAARIS
jgi:transcription antitermination factor NusG